jgi:hypothetical protein
MWISGTAGRELKAAQETVLSGRSLLLDGGISAERKPDMKLLVATKQPDTEFCFVPEGEILFNNISVCCKSDSCGCNRSLSGTTTFKATTTAKVAEVDMSDQELFELAANAGKESGWGGPTVWASFQGIRGAIEGFELGTIVRPEFDFDTEDWKYIKIASLHDGDGDVIPEQARTREPTDRAE